MDDPRPGFPEANPMFGRDAREEVIDFLVLSERPDEVVLRPLFRLDQVITMDGGGDCDAGHSRRHELQQSHLRRRVLHGDPVGGELDVRGSPLRQ